MIFTRCFIFFVLLYPVAQKGNCDESLETSVDTSANSSQTSNSDDETTSEIHYTNCKIVTDKLSLDAQAKFTRVFARARTDKIVEDRFKSLEKLLNERLNDLRELIIRSITKLNSNFHETNDRVLKTQMACAMKNRFEENIFEFDENDIVPSRGSDEGNELRQGVIDRDNDTIREVSVQRKVYTYYWRILDLLEKLSKWDTGQSERSPSFYVGDTGYAMYLRFIPKYLLDGPIVISVGLTAGHNDSKIGWPFPLPVRVEIPNLTTRMKNRPKNRSSRLRDAATVCSSLFSECPRGNIIEGTSKNSECMVLNIPKQDLTESGNEHPNYSSSESAPTLLTGKYISNNSLLIKLTVYL